jgi:menaquinone-9 beta-reductase
VDAQVVVVGAGPVGSTLTLLLRRAGLDVELLDKARFPRDKPCGEGMLPAGAAVLRAAGVDLGELGFPLVDATRFRVPGRGWVRGRLAGPAYGVRRLHLDAHLAGLARARTQRPVTGVGREREGWVLTTSHGSLRAPVVVGCDGLRSPLRRWWGWERVAPPSGRYGLVGHLAAPRHGIHEIVITLLGDRESYLAPAGQDQLLLAVLGERGTLREPGRSVEASYLAVRDLAHPDLAAAPLAGAVRGAGPFGVRPLEVAGDGAFLCGDAAGFLDPLTGDGMSAGLLQASCLAMLLGGRSAHPEERYRAQLRSQWRQRRLVTMLARRLSGSARLADRALRGAARRPLAMDRLLLAASGPPGLAALRPRDWMALAGW